MKAKGLQDIYDDGMAAIGECLDAVFPAIPYCIDLLGGPYLLTDEKRLKAFRPVSAANR